MKPAVFDYVCPETVSEALSVLARYGADARIIAGGQSLGAMLNMRLVRPRVLVDIGRLGELCKTESDAGTVTTGAMVRQSDALADPRIRDAVPLLAQALPHVGHYQTRNRGTLGGSIAHADPSAELPLVLAALGGEIELRSRRGRRRLTAAQFLRSALVTAREPDELVTGLSWPRAAGRRHAFYEFAIREGDYAIVAVACVVEPGANGSVRLAFGGCGETPQIVALPAPAAGLDDGATTGSIAREAAARIECRSDMLASADYRRHLAAVLARKTLLCANSKRDVDA